MLTNHDIKKMAIDLGAETIPGKGRICPSKS
jgi:hypothetical protein